MNHKARNQKNKAVVWDYWQRMNHAEPGQIAGIVKKAFHRDVNWNGPQPINQIRGTDALITQFWEPLLHSFPDIRRNADILMGGANAYEDWVSGMGYLTGTFVHDWLGIPANGKKTNIHFGQFLLLRDQKIVESYAIFDILSVMKQAGFQVLPTALGAEGGKVLKPQGGDGILLTEQDDLETRKTLQIVESMWNGMSRYVRSRDGSNLESMEQQHYWHPDFHWYGPTGIGTSHTLEEYQDFHQGPWLTGFGDRSTPGDPGGRQLGYMGEGNYASAGIWDYKFSLHHGEYLGVPATGKMMTMRDFDWYKRDGEVLTQNWVPIDIIDLLMQMDVNLFDRMHHQIEQRKRRDHWYAGNGY